MGGYVSWQTAWNWLESCIVILPKVSKSCPRKAVSISSSLWFSEQKNRWWKMNWNFGKWEDIYPAQDELKEHGDVRRRGICVLIFIVASNRF